MKTTFRLAASLVLLTGIAGCEPLGDGSTVETLQLAGQASDLEHSVTVAATATEPQYVKMYDCFCSNLAVLATFTDGTVSNFIYRAELSSSDPAVVRVLNYGDDIGDRCPSLQGFPGMLIPESPGTAVITARFAGLMDTLEVRVVDTQTVSGSFTLTPAPPATSTAVAVSGFLPLSLIATLDGRTRNVNRNVRAWTLAPEDEGIATVDTLGIVTGVAVDPANTPRTLTASFGDNCPVQISSPVSIGDILGPLSLAREPGLVADGDTLLAANSDELVHVTAGLDFDNDGTQDATQVLNPQVTLTVEEPCTLRVYDATVPTTNCAETAGMCLSSTAQCPESTAQVCPSTLTTACRTAAASLLPTGNNRIVGVFHGPAPAQISVSYPRLLGAPTTLVGAIDDTATTLQVEELIGYPTVLPWYAVIDVDGAREDVKVTARDDTTLTVVRGVTGGGAGSVAGPHPAAATFEQRAYRSSSPLSIQSQGGTLSVVDVVDPGAGPFYGFGTVQLTAQGTFTDDVSATREQRVTRLLTFSTGSPTVSWTSSNTGVAFVGPNNGLVSASTACGGNVTIRARSNTSADTVDDVNDPDSTDDDTACGTDPLCDQVDLCIDGINPLPDGAVCEDGPHDCTP